MCGGPVYWKLKKQAIIVLFSMETEYIAAGEIVKDLAWIQQLINRLGFEQKNPTNLYTNSKSIIDFADKRNTENILKYINLKYYYMRQQVRNGKIKMIYITTTKMPADKLTKDLKK